MLPRHLDRRARGVLELALGELDRKTGIAFGLSAKIFHGLEGVRLVTFGTHFLKLGIQRARLVEHALRAGIEFPPVLEQVLQRRQRLVRWLSAGFAPMNAMCERAGMSERAIFERTKALFEYFDLPFDAPAPG